MEAYSTKAKAEDKRKLLMERRAKLKVLLDNEMKQLEVLDFLLSAGIHLHPACLHLKNPQGQNVVIIC